MKKVFLGFGLTLLLTVVLITMAITGEVVKDPVCKMEVDPAKATLKIEGKAGSLYFCSQSCEDAFKKNPTAYVTQADLEKMGIAVVNAGAKAEGKTKAEDKAKAAGCGGCPMGAGDTKAACAMDTKTAKATGCDGNCGNTVIPAINDFHSSMHVMESAIDANNMEMVKGSMANLVAKKDLVMKAECPGGKCPNSFEVKRTDFSAKVDALAAACGKDDVAAIKTAFTQMHDAYTALDHAVR
ncbi:MAG: YHS domain-containing protein [bacterium]|nr:YHS domain-containing protein [bacterium]